MGLYERLAGIRVGLYAAIHSRMRSRLNLCILQFIFMCFVSFMRLTRSQSYTHTHMRRLLHAPKMWNGERALARIVDDICTCSVIYNNNNNDRSSTLAIIRIASHSISMHLRIRRMIHLQWFGTENPPDTCWVCVWERERVLRRGGSCIILWQTLPYHINSRSSFISQRTCTGTIITTAASHSLS